MQAFIFDMDGVIVDSELHWKKPEGFFLRSLVPNWTDADQTRIIGLSLDNMYRLLTTEYGVTHSKDDFLEVYMAMARQIYREMVSLMPGFAELMSDLHRRGTPVALASSSTRSWIDIVLDRFDLRSDFDAVVSADDLVLAKDMVVDWDYRRDRVRIFELHLRTEPPLRIDNREITEARFVDPLALLAMDALPPFIREYLSEPSPRRQRPLAVA